MIIMNKIEFFQSRRLAHLLIHKEILKTLLISFILGKILFASEITELYMLLVILNPKNQRFNLINQLFNA